MKPYFWLVFAFSILAAITATAQDGAPAPVARHITLQEAVQLALHHNHVVRIAGLQVEEKQYAKDVAKSSYFPTLRNDSGVVEVTDTQFIAIPAGSFGTAGSTPIPSRTLILNQGGNTFIASGTQLTQPLTQYLKFKPQNAIARADLNATRDHALQTQNDVALKVHQIYYQLLITQLHRSATLSRIKANDDLQAERVQQVKYGSVLQEDLIDSRVQYLQAKQELLSTELRISDLTLALNDAMGLSLNIQLSLDPSVPPAQATCQMEECIRVALDSHPEVLEAMQEVDKAAAGIRVAKAEYVPDITAFARHSYQNNVPFLARNFGSFGVHLGYDLFDGGKRRSTLREREAELAQAKENLARVKHEVELRVQTAYNKLERTRQMVKVAEELLALREESSRVSAQQLARGVALKSQTDAAAAQELDARTSLLQSQLDYIQAQDEVTHAIGRTPE
ncbi:MAG TPA: TolC family protein [Terriglobales bacterium]|jgi:outer membrane protein TolC|nr:TolC family protein [Terriglobales bacterium]